MESLLKTIEALQGTSVPNLLILVGGVFLLLAFVGKIGATIELPQHRQKWAGLIGALFLTTGIILSSVPGRPSSDKASQAPNTGQRGASRAPPGPISPPPKVPPSPEPAPPPISPEGVIEEAENFKFRLQGCVLSKGDVTCKFTVTNIGQDALLTLWNDTSVFDNLGGKYTLAKAWIGNEWHHVGAINHTSREMISDVPVDIRLVFSGLPQGARQITKLIVDAKRGAPTRIGERPSFSMSFRDIALSLE
jgi:hypothetical protein